MNTAHQYYSPPHTEPSTIPFNLANYFSNIISDPTLSKNASATLIQLTLSAGRKGYCELLIYSISVKVKSSRTQTKLYLKELQDKKRIKIIYRTGRSSIYQILDILPEKVGPSRFSDYIKDIKKRKNQRSERTNVVLNFPEKTKPAAHSESETTEQFIETEPSPILAEDNNINITKPVNNTGPAIQKPILHQSTKPIKTYSNVVDMTLVQEILQITNDKKSLNCFIKIVKNCPEDIIFAALSSLKIAMEENYILRPGAYFVSTIKSYYPDIFNSQKNAPVTPPTKNNSSVVPLGTSKEQYLEPEDNIIPASPEIVKEAISAIKSILDKPRCNMLMPGGKKSGKVIIQNH
jgi:hypothetical protein